MSVWNEVTDPEAAKQLICSGYYLNKSFVPDRFDDLPRGGKWLDFGCGLGRNLLAMRERCDELHGYDYPNMISMVPPETAQHCLLIQPPVTNLKDAYDLIHASLVFQHIPEVELREILEHLCGCLRVGPRAQKAGHLLIRSRGYLDERKQNIWPIIGHYFQFLNKINVEDGTENHQTTLAVPR